MKLSITNHVVGYEEKESIRMIAEAGFDAVDLCLYNLNRFEDDPYMAANYMEHVREIKKLGEDLGISYNQCHCVFPPYRQDDSAYNALAWKALLRTLEIAQELEIKTIAYHPFRLNYGDEFSANVGFLQKLTPYIAGSGARLLLENTFYYAPPYPKKVAEVTQQGLVIRDELMPRKRFTKTGSYCIENKKMLEQLDPNCFGCLLDTGHAVLVHENPADAVRLLGDSLMGLHVHDVDGYNDSHSLPYDTAGVIDWDDVAEALSEVHYQGDFTMESELFTMRFPKEVVPYGYKLMERMGRSILAKIGGEKDI